MLGEGLLEGVAQGGQGGEVLVDGVGEVLVDGELF